MPEIAASMNKTEVVLVSATWCKRCGELKPDIIRLCAIAGISFAIVDYDELEDDDPIKTSVKALPTIRMRKAGETDWRNYTPAEIETWRAEVTALPVAVTGDDDF